MIHLNKEPTGFKSVVRKILNKKEAICFVEGCIQGKRRRRWWESIIDLLSLRWRNTSVSVVVKLNNGWKRRKKFSWCFQSTVFIKERWNGDFERIVEPFFIVLFDMKGFFQGVNDKSVRLIQIRCICCVDRFTRFERWWRGYKSYAINFNSGLTYLCNFRTK